MGLVYISYSETDKDYVNNIIKHAKDRDYDSLNFNTAPLLEYWDTSSMSVMQNFILKKMKITNRTLIFVGDDTHESDWLPVEVDMSRELKHPIVAMRVRGTKGEIPECLVEHGIKVEDWDIEVLQYIATK